MCLMLFYRLETLSEQKILTFAITWMNLEDLKLSEISQ